MKKLLIFIISTLIFSCGVTESENDFILNSWASVDQIEIIKNDNGEITFKISLGIPDPCHIYQDRDVEIINDTLYIRYYSKSKTDAVCPAVLSSIEINDTFILPSNYTYNFKFWQLGETYLDTLVYLN
jgi:hypothetical protein